MPPVAVRDADRRPRSVEGLSGGAPDAVPRRPRGRSPPRSTSSSPAACGSCPRSPASPGTGPLTCVLDPIDGSTNFDRGIPYYATSLCVLDEHGLRCSLVVNLATDTWYEAVRGGGATRDGAPIAPSGVTATRAAHRVVLRAAVEARRLGAVPRARLRVARAVRGRRRLPRRLRRRRRVAPVPLGLPRRVCSSLEVSGGARRRARRRRRSSSRTASGDGRSRPARPGCSSELRGFVQGLDAPAAS